MCSDSARCVYDAVDMVPFIFVMDMGVNELDTQPGCGIKTRTLIVKT